MIRIACEIHTGFLAIYKTQPRADVLQGDAVSGSGYGAFLFAQSALQREKLFLRDAAAIVADTDQQTIGGQSDINIDMTGPVQQLQPVKNAVFNKRLNRQFRQIAVERRGGPRS